MINNMIPDSEIIGKRFNYLTGIRYDKTKSQSRRYFIFKCQLCGKEKSLNLTAVYTGRVKSCGCLKSIKAKERHRKTRKRILKNVLNKKFNYLKILDIFNNGKYLCCKCKCICGKIFNYRLDRVKSGYKKSCGCKTNRCKRTRFRYIDGSGYYKIYSSNHQRADKYGYVHEHILMMENYLKRPLNKKEVIHHKDDNRSNNILENLKLFASQKEHMKWHFLKTKLQLKYLSKTIKLCLKQKLNKKQRLFVENILEKYNYKPTKQYSYKGNK